MKLPETHICSICRSVSKINYDWMETLVGYFSPPGHNHDDNCLSATFTCENGHDEKVSVKRRCPNPECDWEGKDSCFCHPDEKIEIEEIQ